MIERSLNHEAGACDVVPPKKRAFSESRTNVARPRAGQVVGDLETGDAAADNNDSGLIVHAWSPTSSHS